MAFDIAKSLEDIESWKLIAGVSMKNGRFDLARESLWNANDYATLLFLCYCLRDAGTIRKIASQAFEKKLYNVAFLANHILGKYLNFFLFYLS